jgi:hypothetical protein
MCAAYLAETEQSCLFEVDQTMVVKAVLSVYDLLWGMEIRISRGLAFSRQQLIGLPT